MGQAVLDLVVEQASRKGIAYTIFDRQQDSVAFQLKVAEHRCVLKPRTFTLSARQRTLMNWPCAEISSTGWELPDCAPIRGWAVDQVTQAIDSLLSAHGAGSFAESNPLQRFWRDSAVAARHAAVPPMMGYEVYGKALLGVEEQIEYLA